MNNFARRSKTWFSKRTGADLIGCGFPSDPGLLMTVDIFASLDAWLEALP
jgi:hypothetical protein